MKRFLVYLLVTTTIYACTNEQQSLSSKIAQLEETIESDSSPETANSLLSSYQDYLKQFPEDAALNPRYLYRMAGLLYRMNKFQESEKYLKQALRQYPQNDNAFNSAMLLGNIYEEHYGNRFVSQTVYQNLIEVFPNEDLSKIKGKVSPNLASTDKRLGDLQLQIFNDSTGVINYQKANDFISATELFALINPNKATIAENLFKAAETARTIRANQKALDIYKWIYEQYADHPKAPQALFLQAFTLDNELGQIEEARSLYEKFITDYPSDEFADDAQFLLNNLGKTNEEIIKAFEEKNPEN